MDRRNTLSPHSIRRQPHEESDRNDPRLVAFNAQFLQWLRLLPDELEQLEHYFKREKKPTVRLEAWHDPSQYQKWENREQKLKSEHDERCANLKNCYEERLRKVKESLERDKDDLKRRLEKSEAVAFEKDEEIMALKRKLEESQEHVTRSGNITKDMERYRKGYDQELWETKQALEEKEKELKKLKERHAAISERKVRSDQRKSENTLSANRQSQLEGQYVTDFKDGARVDAVEVITKRASRWGTKPSASDYLKNCRFACFIFETAYECALNAKNSFAKFTSTALEILSTDAPEIGLDKNAFKKKLAYRPQYTSTDGHTIQLQDALSEVMVLVKEHAKKHDLTLLISEVKNEVSTKWIRKNNVLPSYDSTLLLSLEEYIKYCTIFAWCLVSQVPPLQIGYKNNIYNSKTHVLSQAFSFGDDRTSSSFYHQTYPEAQKTILCYLWPTLQDCEGRVIIKGEVLLARYQ